MRVTEIAAGCALILAVFAGLSALIHNAGESWTTIACIWAFALTVTGVLVLASVLLAGGWS